MDTFVAGLVADHPGVSDPAERRCVLLGGRTRRLERQRPTRRSWPPASSTSTKCCQVQLHSR